MNGQDINIFVITAPGNVPWITDSVHVNVV